jgi:nitrate/TMAO reductase-like tetraheme cytochrome c subunit
MMGYASTLFAQISPGDLTTAHANLEGMSNCTKCHELGDKVENSKCLDCHKEIKSLIDTKRGFHASAEVQGKNCFKCHSEHHGRKFRIVNIDPKKFDHNKAGYKLEGTHATTKCNDCHLAKFISDGEIKKRKGTYLGLSSDCISCHEDFHKNTLGTDCSKCHNTVKYSSAIKFDHNKSKYKLTGLHLKVDCAKCHPKEKGNEKVFRVFKVAAFSNCSPCHQDVHKGKFGVDCQSCHQTVGFKIINGNSFDHNKTDFPLVGKHQEVNCNQCHKTNLKQKMPHKFCTDCHEDYHKGQFVVDSIVRQCTDCHNEQGFKPSLFTIDEHNQIQFKLTGGHLKAKCESCHQKDSTQPWVFSTLSNECVGCHENIHGVELKVKYFPDNRCEYCHQTEKWATINFDHNTTEFSLQGKHSSQTCRKCHESEIIPGSKKILFASIGKNCESCHKDVHFSQFKENGISDCGKCHGFNDWKAEKFNHSSTRFSLEGAHKNLDCIKCHPKVQSADVIFIKYKLEDFKCAACHK